MLAWSAQPAILGFFIALILVPALVFLGGRSLTATDWTTGVLMLIMALCDLWSVIVFALMLSRVEGFGFWRTFVTYTFGTMLSAAFSAFISIAIRTLLFQPFSIPAASMVPTVLVGDYIFVSKYSYGYTHYSIPFAPPWFSGRIFASEPARGDVVAFRAPKDDSVVYVKRVVGLPGDRIQVR